MAVVVDFHGIIQPQNERLHPLAPAGMADVQPYLLLRHKCALKAANIQQFTAIQGKYRSIHSFGKLQRQDPHADQVGPVDALIGGGYHCPHTQEAGALGSPVA